MSPTKALGAEAGLSDRQWQNLFLVLVEMPYEVGSSDMGGDDVSQIA